MNRDEKLYEQLSNLATLSNSFSRLPNLLEVAPQYPRRIWLRVLGESWDVCDEISKYQDRLWPLLKRPRGRSNARIDEMTSVAERQRLDNFPDDELIPIFRGCGHHNIDGICWSLDRSKALQILNC